MARILTTAALALAFGAAAVGGAGALLAANVAPAGEKVFKSDCAVCHSTSAKGGPTIGPTMFGVVGRKAGSLPGYHYSSAMEMAGLVWTQSNLDKYIANPKSVVPGDKMPYAGLKNAQKRDALVEYLKTLK